VGGLGSPSTRNRKPGQLDFVLVLYLGTAVGTRRLHIEFI